MAKTAETKFFHQLAEPLEAFVHMKVPRRDKKNKKRVALTFRMPLNGNNVRSVPDFIQIAYEGVKEHGQRHDQLSKEIEGVEIEIFELPNKRQKTIFTISSARLENFAVKEIRSGKGDPSIVLTFETLEEWESSLWRFLGNHYASTVFLKFDTSQASLLDLPEAKGKDEKEQPSLPGTEVATGEFAEEPAPDETMEEVAG